MLIAEKGRTTIFLEIESFTIMNKAKTKNDVTYLKKAYPLETKEEIKTLAKTLSILEGKIAQS